MDNITVSQPIPQQQIYIGMISSSASLQTPSSFQMSMMPNCPKEPCIHFGVPPPDSNPIPFESVDFNHFQPNFQSSPFCDNYNDDNNEFLEEENDFGFNL